MRRNQTQPQARKNSGWGEAAEHPVLWRVNTGRHARRCEDAEVPDVRATARAVLASGAARADPLPVGVAGDAALPSARDRRRRRLRTH